MGRLVSVLVLRGQGCNRHCTGTIMKEFLSQGPLNSHVFDLKCRKLGVKNCKYVMLEAAGVAYCHGT